MGIFESEIVQQEAKQLFTDYQQLVSLGSKYGKFDRDGKKMYIEQMEGVLDRYRIFMKRFELSTKFSYRRIMITYFPEMDYCIEASKIRICRFS